MNHEGKRKKKKNISQAPLHVLITGQHTAIPSLVLSHISDIKSVYAAYSAPSAHMFSCKLTLCKWSCMLICLNIDVELAVSCFCPSVVCTVS